MTTIKRTDLVRIAVEQLRAEIAQEINDAARAVGVARDAFRAAMLRRASEYWEEEIGAAVIAVGTDRQRIVCDVHLDMTDDVLASPPDHVMVTVSDDELYSARLVMRLRLPVMDVALQTWVAAVKRHQAAVARGTRSKDLDAAARAKAVDDLLSATPEGARVLAALSEFSKAAKLKGAEE